MNGRMNNFIPQECINSPPLESITHYSLPLSLYIYIYIYKIFDKPKVPELFITSLKHAFQYMTRRFVLPKATCIV